MGSRREKGRASESDGGCGNIGIGQGGNPVLGTPRLNSWFQPTLGVGNYELLGTALPPPQTIFLSSLLPLEPVHNFSFSQLLFYGAVGV